MSIAGAYRLGPKSGRLLVNTTRTGLGAKAGHDLTIEVTRWHGHATVDTAVPANSSVTVQVDVDSFQVRQGTGGVKPLTDADRAEISKTLQAGPPHRPASNHHLPVQAGGRRVGGVVHPRR